MGRGLNPCAVFYHKVISAGRCPKQGPKCRDYCCKDVSPDKHHPFFNMLFNKVNIFYKFNKGLIFC